MAEVEGVECMIGSMMESAVSVAGNRPSKHNEDRSGHTIMDEPFEGIRFIEDQLLIADEHGIGVKWKSSFT